MANRLMDARAHQINPKSGSLVGAANGFFQQPHTRLRVALVCLVWGQEFADFFAQYCVRSLLEPNNIPLISRNQDITFMIYTDRQTQEFLERCDSIKSLSRFAEIEWLALGQLPPTARTNHWVPWQHAVAGRSRDFDRFLVVIPDCVYAAGSFRTILEALEEHDTVYYRLPQVCRETVTVDLDGRRRVDGHEYISFSALQAVELFISHVNPKHAAAACSGTFFLNHPEYLIQLSAKSMVVSETGSHPFAVRSSTRGVSYTLGALSADAKTCYLEILGVSAEPATKFVEDYYRWPKLHRDHSRLMNLGNWAWNFRDASNAAYSKSATYMALDGGRVLDQHRGHVKRGKTKFINAMLDYLAGAIRIYWHACARSDAGVAKYIALAIAAPGFHRHLRRLQSGLTVVLPKSERPFREVVEKIEGHPDARRLLRRFLFLHVVPHRLPMVPGHAVFLAFDAADEFPKAFVVDPNTVALGPGLWGKAISPLQWVWENVFSIEADIDYAHLTWSMLDPVNGTSERVLDLPKSNGSVADVEKLQCGKDRGRAPEPARHMPLPVRSAVKFDAMKAYLNAAKRPVLGPFARLGRNLYRKVNGRPSLRVQTRTEPAPSLESPRDSYDAISKLNIIDNVAKVTAQFYESLELDPYQSPVYRCLARLRSQLADDVGSCSETLTECPLERFEHAWHAYEAGKVNEALRLFRMVAADEHLAKRGATDPRSREAFVRSAEITGRHAELKGDARSAAELYSSILKIDGGGGVVARRLLLMLWRDSRIREAAEIAPRALTRDGNLGEHLRGSEAVNDLRRRLAREARRESQ